VIIKGKHDNRYENTKYIPIITFTYFLQLGKFNGKIKIIYYEINCCWQWNDCSYTINIISNTLHIIKYKADFSKLNLIKFSTSEIKCNSTKINDIIPYGILHFVNHNVIEYKAIFPSVEAYRAM